MSRSTGINRSINRSTDRAQSHASRPSSLSLAADSSRHLHNFSRRTILVVIVLAMITVVFAVFTAILITPERIITGQIESLVEDYYEHYFYDTVGMYNQTSATRADILATYHDKGFATLTLHDLLYSDDGRHLNQRSALEEYCDLDSTSFIIYPDPPFGRTDYHVDYRYDCNF